MAVVDNAGSGPIFARELSEHLRFLGVPVDKWLRYSIYVQLHEDGGVLTAYQEIVDTGFRSVLPPDVSEDKMTSLTDTGVQTGQLGPEADDPRSPDLSPTEVPDWMKVPSSMTNWIGQSKSHSSIQGGDIREPVHSTALEASGLREKLRQVEEERDCKEELLGQFHADLHLYFGRMVGSVYQAYAVLVSTQGERAAALRQRDEASALALRSLELLRMVPTASMSEDVEVAHHALVADPRTRETEAVLEGYLSATVDRRASELVRDRLAESLDKQRWLGDRITRMEGDADARVVELESRASYQRARGWCEMGLVMVVGIALIGWLT